jgi:hypothetical protein
MIAWQSSFCPPQGIKGLNDFNGPNAYGGWGKTAIPSIFKQEWCGSMVGNLLSQTKILIILK